MNLSNRTKNSKNMKMIIFDLDGVLLNSKINMKFAWNFAKKENNLNTPFENYFKNIGYPFKKILNKLKINKNQLSIQKSFKKGSIKNINRIKLYPDVKKVLKYLKKKEYLIGILTSKDKSRTQKILKKFELYNFFNFIECPTKHLRGKPFPDCLLKNLKKYSIKSTNATFVGDMLSDYQAAKRAKIKFIFAKYGYGSVKKTKSIKKMSELLKIF